MRLALIKMEEHKSVTVQVDKAAGKYMWMECCQTLRFVYATRFQGWNAARQVQQKKAGRDFGKIGTWGLNDTAAPPTAAGKEQAPIGRKLTGIKVNQVKTRLMIAAAFCAALFLFSGAMLAREYLDQKQSAEAFEEVAELVKEDTELPSLEAADTPEQSPKEKVTAF